jgi:hypothetical protein
MAESSTPPAAPAPPPQPPPVAPRPVVRVPKVPTVVELRAKYQELTAKLKDHAHEQERGRAKSTDPVFIEMREAKRKASVAMLEAEEREAKAAQLPPPPTTDHMPKPFYSPPLP